MSHAAPDGFKAVIAKVAKLLALAEGKGATPAEAATAAATAQRLMLQYRVERADVDQVTDDDPFENTGRVTQGPDGRGNIYEGFIEERKRWKGNLLASIAQSNGCMLYTAVRSGRKWMNLVGRRSDVEVCRYLWTYLAREIERLKLEQTKGWSQARKGHFCLGAAHTVGAALVQETMAAASSASGISAEIVQRSRYDAARTWYEADHPRLRSMKSRRATVDMDAYRTGQAAGSGVSIRKGMSTATSNPRRLLT